MRLWSHPLLACHSPSPSLRFIFLSSPCVSLAFAWILAFFCQVQHTHKHTSSIYINTHTFILSLAFLPPHFVSKDSTREPLTHTLTHIHFSCKWFPDLHFIHRHTHTITPRRTYITSCVIQGLKTIVLLFRQCGHCCSLNLQSLQWMSFFFFLSFSFIFYPLLMCVVCSTPGFRGNLWKPLWGAQVVEWLERMPPTQWIPVRIRPEDLCCMSHPYLLPLSDLSTVK